MLRSMTIAAFAGAAMTGAVQAQDMDIVETAAASDDFSTLVTAVQTAGLVDALKGDGPFTVFAPTDAAFEKLEAGTVESLLEEENRDQLTAILTYHVIEGRVMYEDVVGEMASPATLEGSTVEIDATGSNPTVNGAEIVGADIEASNGVIHAIDSVLMPDLPN